MERLSVWTAWVLRESGVSPRSIEESKRVKKRILLERLG